MSAHCGHSHGPSDAAASPRYRRVLWVALVVNAAMFGIELASGLHAGSVALLADAIDFLGDAANYGVSLAVLGMAIGWRARAALLKGLTMGAFGVFVLGRAAWSATSGTVPEPVTMGAIGALALAANVGVAAMLYAWRDGDANMRSVWLCSRNDAIGNVAVMVAALGVFGTGTAWPDLAVAAVMGVLALMAAWSVVQQALGELRSEARASGGSPPSPAPHAHASHGPHDGHGQATAAGHAPSPPTAHRSCANETARPAPSGYAPSSSTANSSCASDAVRPAG